MKILIKGAGDLASGIAVRLVNAGYDVLMTEIAVPTTVRRTVAFSRAVYEQEAEVEGIPGKLVVSIGEAEEIQRKGGVPVIVDEMAAIRERYYPEAVVDAIVAKKNLGTSIGDAPLVIGVGPGFEAGRDCHAVVETMRGHYLGRVIRKGSAIANTGTPGNIGGYTVERIIRANADGVFKPVARIGDMVEVNQLIAYSGKEPVCAGMTGMVRGMLQQGVMVHKGMKCGDIDARCNLEHCFTVSDKARAIGGGVLEAVSCYEHKNQNGGKV